ncbi:hypothetical protein AQ914_18160 [Burkholderia pseudomallei]|nr:hypothetical protein AQ914_18160 [Burkholderia pseudomallei]
MQGIVHRRVFSFPFLTSTCCVDRIRIGNGDVAVPLASNSSAVVAFADQSAGQSSVRYVVAHQLALAIRVDHPNFKHIVSVWIVTDRDMTQHTSFAIAPCVTGEAIAAADASIMFRRTFKRYGSRCCARMTTGLIIGNERSCEHFHLKFGVHVLFRFTGV